MFYYFVNDFKLLLHIDIVRCRRDIVCRKAKPVEAAGYHSLYIVSFSVLSNNFINENGLHPEAESHL